MRTSADIASADIAGLYERHADDWIARRKGGPLIERVWLDRFCALLPPGGSIVSKPSVMPCTLPEDLFPVTQENVHAAFDWVFAPWIKEMGLTDIEVREGFCAMRLPLNDRLKFFSGAVCGQALMAAIDTVASVAAMTGPRTGKGTAYQHTHFVRPAANDDFRIEAIVRRFGKASAYVECSVTFAASGDLVAHAVLEFAF